MDRRRTSRPGEAERRAPEGLVFTPGQLLGRTPIRLRRRRDKIRVAAHLSAAAALAGLSLWWVIPRHAFSGPVLVALTTTHGVHAGDLPTLLFAAVALRSLVAAWRVVAQAARFAPAVLTVGTVDGASPGRAE